MKTIIINKDSIVKSSFGIVRYTNKIVDHLKEKIPNNIIFEEKNNFYINNLYKKISSKYILWSPSMKGPLLADNHIVTIHDVINLELNSKWLKKNYLHFHYATITKTARKIVFISNSSLNRFCSYFYIPNEKITLIKSSNESFFSNIKSLRPNNFQLKKGSYILTIANSSKNKNIDLIIENIAKTKINQKELSYIFVGDFSIKHQYLLKNQINKIYFMKNINNNNMAWLIENCIFLVSPSLQEGHNLVINEALGKSKNVLCSNIPAHKEFYDGLCYFFNIEDNAGFVDKFNFLLDFPSNEKKTIVIKRTYNDVAEDYIKLFKSIN